MLFRSEPTGSAPVFVAAANGGSGGGGQPAAWGTGGGRGPAYLRNPVPSYPRVARLSGWEGTTVLRVLVRKDGRGDKIEISQSSGFPILDESSVETVRRWRFLPARAGEEPVDSWVEIPIRFQLLNG